MAAITIGSLKFPSKKAAKEFFREIRDRYPDGVTIGEQDTHFLLELINCHPESEQKIGSGVSGFSVRTDDQFRTTRHFVVFRKDGSSTDFSFHSCIDGENPRKDRLEALRRAIEDQIIAFRDVVFAQGCVSCPITGCELSKNSCHIDHCPPNTFAQLVTRWTQESGITLKDIQITPPQDNQAVTRMVDMNQLISWTTFHELHARLRAVAPLANLSTLKRKE